MKSLLIACVLSFWLVLPVSADTWERYHGTSNGGKYRYVEQYAPTNDNMVQRIDFTYSKKTGWELYVTTRFIADEVTLIVDGKKFVFHGQPGFHKMSFPVSQELLEAVRKTSQPIIVSERYNFLPEARFTAKVNPSGLMEALRWAEQVQ